MNLLALLIGLIIERLATRLFHWRRMRWLERLIDTGFRVAMRVANWPAILLVLLLAIILILPVFIVMFALGDALHGFPYFFLAIVVLFFSLGPKDIGEDVDEYCAAIEAGDEELARQRAKTLVEGPVSADPEERSREVEEAVFVQANNRLFAVIFWFVALGPLGPLGAWAYRVTDLIRRRAVFNTARDAVGTDADTVSDDVRDAAVRLHGWLAWVPARLTAVGYAIAGHFDAAFSAWRAPTPPSATGSAASEQVLARVGVGALALQTQEGESSDSRAIRGASAANRLVFRLLLIWAVIIAGLTLYGWSQ
mgnify:CR=1 FL=1|tara:strand:+ start:12431 stop:13357 length:927 start_codon:yes stop_codon:yes gene_type:complete